ncbi:MAG: hypothetical protein ACKV0T_17165 [Planctomycetales bacterium]
MLFTLEAVEAKAGDSLLLHVGTAKSPELVVIDGGPAGVYTGTLKPRLDELRSRRTPDQPLPIRMVMVSHIDDDHINGIVQLGRDLKKRRDRKQAEPYRILTLWHNSFNDILGDDEKELTKSFTASLKATSVGSPLPKGGLQEHSALVLASVGQGRELRDLAKGLNWSVNEGFLGLVAFADGKKAPKFKLAGKATLTVLGPSQADLAALQTEWAKTVKKLGPAKTAAFVDDSVFNLSSIVVLAECGGRTMLLTGDARGDEVLAGLTRAKLLKNGKIKVDLLKLPHHGSDRNVAPEFFQAIIADHYVVSGDGKHGNPEVETLQMLSDARGNDVFTIHLTNTLPKLTAFFKKEKAAGKKYNVVFREPKALSLKVDLGDPLAD